MTKFVNFNNIKDMTATKKTSKSFWWAANLFIFILRGPPLRTTDIKEFSQFSRVQIQPTCMVQLKKFE